VTSAGSWHRRFFRDMREAAKLDVVEPGGTREPLIGKGRQVAQPGTVRPEARHEDPSHAAPGTPARAAPAASPGEPPPRPDGVERVQPVTAGTAEHVSARRGAGTGRREPQWTAPDVPEAPASYAIYRPEKDTTAPTPTTPRVRSETR
jgi:hypothetical protein